MGNVNGKQMYYDRRSTFDGSADRRGSRKKLFLSDFCLLSAKQFQPEQTDRTENFSCRNTVSHFPAM